MTRLALSRYLRYLSQTRGGTGSGSSGYADGIGTVALFALATRACASARRA